MPIELGRACFAEYYIFSKKSEYDIEKLYYDLYENLVNIGANVDRPHGRVTELIYSKNPSYRDFLKLVKNQLDPNGILNPNRFIL